MTTFFLSDNIEFPVSGLDEYNYSLYLSSDLNNPIFSGINYPFPQNILTTKNSIIKLNDIVENYVGYNNNILDLTSGIVNIQKPINFVLKITGLSDQTFKVVNRWLKIGEAPSVNLMNNKYVKDYSYNNYILVTYSPTDNTQNDDDLRQVNMYTYFNDTQIEIYPIYFEASVNDIVTIRIYVPNYISNNVNKIIFSDLKDEGSTGFIKLYMFNVGQCYPDNYIYYLNRNGAIEMIGGTKGDKINSTNEINDYIKDYRTWNGINYSGNQSNFSSTRNQVNSTDTFVIKTRLLTNNEHNALEDLYSSPLIWIVNNGVMYSVILTDYNYEQKKYSVDKLISRELKFKKSIKNKRR